MNRVLNGVFAGFVATIPMTAVLEALRRALPGHVPLPPRQVAMGVLRKAGVKPYVDAWGEPGRQTVTMVSHFGYGATVGGVYAAVEPALPARVPPAARGASFGLLVWAASYFGLLPAIGLLAPALDRPVRKHAALIGAHLAWGAVTGVLVDRLRRRDDRVRTPRAASHGPSARRRGPVLAGL